MSFQRVTHVLFDMDGLLLNTEELYTEGFQKIASRFGKEFTFELKCKIMGQHSREYAKTIIDDLQLPLSVDEFIAESKTIFDDLFPQCKLMPGAEKLLRHLHKHKVPIALATSSSIESYNLKVQNHLEIFDLFQHKTWGSSDPNVRRGKPYPDIFIVTAMKFPDTPSLYDCLVFEDSINGVLAARAADMQVVMVPDPRLDVNLAKKADANLVLNSLEDFLPEMFGLPAYEN